jgi:uncharacterized protein YndB with AHSA1/START domain
MSVINKEITVHAPRTTVWQYFEKPDLLAGWLMRNNFNGRLGEEFQFFAQPSNDFDGVLNCRLVEYDPPRKLAYTWDASDINGETLVTIELFEEAESTRIRLIHANFENATGDIEKIFQNHDEGWADHLHVLDLQIQEKANTKRQPPMPIDWTQFDLHVAIAAEPERILESWSTVDGMESFFVEMMRITGPDDLERAPSKTAQPGDKYIWRWHNGRSVSGTYQKPQADNEVRFTFGESNICISVIPYRDGSLLRLRQFDIAETEEAKMHIHANCRGGWVYFLTILKTLLEKGVDGRDKTRGTGASFGSYFDPESVGVDF